jgi:hypothetical protein
LDGLVRLKQTFNVIPGEREVSVTMEVKNRSAVTTLPDVELDRYFDGDVNNQRLNSYRSTDQSVSGLPQLLGSPVHGLMLTQAPSKAAIFPSVGQIQTFAAWDPNGTSFQGARFCRGSSGVFDNEDLVGGFITSFGDIAPGQTKNVTYRYHGI